MQDDIKRLSRQLNMLQYIKDGCHSIKSEMGEFVLKAMPPYRILGVLSNTKAFDEYEYFRRHKNKDIPLIKSILRKIEFEDMQVVKNEVYIIEESEHGDDNMICYDKCIYTIVAEEINGEDILERMFITAMKYIKDNNYKPWGIAIIKPLLINYSIQNARTYLELYIPVE